MFESLVFILTIDGHDSADEDEDAGRNERNSESVDNPENDGSNVRGSIVVVP
jgi:hypothetical protein